MENVLPKVLSTAKIFLHQYFSVLPRKGVIMTQMFIICRTITKSGQVKQSKNTPQEGMGVYLGTEIIVTGEATGKYCATSSCNLIMSPGSVWAQSGTFRFHLIMECCCVLTTFGLGGSSNIQLMMGGSG